MNIIYCTRCRDKGMLLMKNGVYMEPCPNCTQASRATIEKANQEVEMNSDSVHYLPRKRLHLSK